MTRVATAGIVLGCVVSTAAAEVIVDDFESAPFGQTLASDVVSYLSQSIAVTSADDRRVSEVSGFSGDTGSITIGAADGVYDYSTEGLTRGSSALLFWVGGFAPGVPPSGTGPLSTFDVVALDPPLDLSGESTFEVAYVNDAVAELQVQIFVYGPELDNAILDQGPFVALGAGAGAVAVSYEQIFVDVDPSRVGAIGLALRVAAGDADVSFTRVAAVGGPYVPRVCLSQDGGFGPHLTLREAVVCSSATGASSVDVIRGDLAALDPASIGDVETVACDSPSVEFEIAASPPSGSGFVYLARAAVAGASYADGGGASLTGARLPSGGDCP